MSIFSSTFLKQSSDLPFRVPHCSHCIRHTSQWLASFPPSPLWRRARRLNRPLLHRRWHSQLNGLPINFAASVVVCAAAVNAAAAVLSRGCVLVAVSGGNDRGSPDGFCQPSLLHTHTRTHARARTHTHTHAHARAQTHTGIHTHTHTHVHMHARTHVRTHTRARARAHTHTRTNAHTHTCARTHTYTHARTLPRRHSQ